MRRVDATKANDLSETFQEVARSTLQEGVYGQVCAALMDGRLRPGQRIKLRSLASAMNTSPMPVREALRRLEASHVLEMQAGGVLAVPHPTKEQLFEIRDIRISLEGLAAETAAERMTKNELERTAWMATEMHRLSGRQDDLVPFLSMNREFHFSIYQASGRPVLLSMINSLWLRVAPFFLEICRQHGHMDFSMEQHDRAVAALKRRNGAGARRAIAADIQQAADRIGQLLDKERDGDDPPSRLKARRQCGPLAKKI